MYYVKGVNYPRTQYEAIVEFYKILCPSFEISRDPTDLLVILANLEKAVRFYPFFKPSVLAGLFWSDINSASFFYLCKKACAPVISASASGKPPDTRPADQRHAYRPLNLPDVLPLGPF